jgi:hypothetical protein
MHLRRDLLHRWLEKIAIKGLKMTLLTNCCENLVCITEDPVWDITSRHWVVGYRRFEAFNTWLYAVSGLSPHPFTQTCRMT